MDPFASPGVDSLDVQGRGQIDFAHTLTEGTRAVFTNLPSFIGMGIVLFVTYIVSVCTCVGWMVLIPWVYWAGLRWCLDAVDGKASVGAMIRDILDDPFTTFLRGWGVLLVMMLVMLPSTLIGVAVGLNAPTLEPMRAGLVGAAIQLPSVIYGVMVVRLYPALFYVVERRTTTMGAFSSAWSDTAGSWAPLAALMALLYFIMTPQSVLNMYFTALMQTLPGTQMLDYFLPYYAMLLGGSLLASVLSMVWMCSLASAYRQMHPLPPGEPV
jgi:hypothetical protein